MDQIIVSRHGESVAVAEGTENGDPGADRGLTVIGQEQARELGRQIAGDPIDLCVTSQFLRVQQTATLALSGRAVACTPDSNLDDIRYGEFEGRPKDSYLAWARAHSLTTPVPGGESRVQVAARACTAFHTLLERPEQCALVVTHELLIADLLRALEGQTPAQVHDDVPYATPFRLAAAHVARGVAFLWDWVANAGDTPAPHRTSS